MNKNFQANQNNNLINNKNNDFIYVLVFNAVSNVKNSNKSKEIKLKIIRIIIKIIENIIEAELKKVDSEKYRKIKVTNPNISLIFDIKGNYEFFKSLGFNEKFFGQDLCLYLPKNKVNIPLFYKLISFIELLSLDFQDINNSQNYFELNNQNQINFQNNHNNNQFNHNNNQINIMNLGIMGNNNLGNNFNMRRSPSNQGAKILKETGPERYQRALKFNKTPNNKNLLNINQNKNKINNNIGPNIHTLNDFNQNQLNNNFINLDNNILNKDEIGKKCLYLTNDFRAKNNLPLLKWDDSIWRIAYTHSKNMGDKVVPFGHNGFNQRIKQFPFHYRMACENVFMCLGYAYNTIAFEAIKGWINSPGHRKNLLSHTTHCAIATYVAKNGAYYLTQMFVSKI